MPPQVPEDKHFLQYAVQQAWASGQSEEEVEQYARQMRANPKYLRQAFSDRIPIVTQIFSADKKDLWVRHFDPTVWEFGLSDTWTVVDLGTRQREEVGIPGLGVVHDLMRHGDQILILSSTLTRPGERVVRVSTFCWPA